MASLCRPPWPVDLLVEWHHDPRSRSLAFIITNQGVRTPRVLVFPDYREPPAKKPSGRADNLHEKSINEPRFR